MSDSFASMPAPLGARQLSTALGMRDLGAVRDYIEPLRPARILRKLDIGRFEHLNALPPGVSVAVKVGKIPPFAYAVGALIDSEPHSAASAEHGVGATADDPARRAAAGRGSARQSLGPRATRTELLCYALGRLFALAL